MSKRIINFTIIAIFAGMFFSGCAATTSYQTAIKPQKDKTVVHILADQDATSASWLMSGSVVRTNYMYALATAAQTTKDAGYTFFTIISPSQLVEQFKDRNVVSIQDAYDACDSGSESFMMGLSVKRTYNYDPNNCDAMVRRYQRNTFFGGTVIHKSVDIIIKMHNDNGKKGSFWFNANKVLASDLVSGLDPEYFVNNKR